MMMMTYTIAGCCSYRRLSAVDSEAAFAIQNNRSVRVRSFTAPLQPRVCHRHHHTHVIPLYRRTGLTDGRSPLYRSPQLRQPTATTNTDDTVMSCDRLSFLFIGAAHIDALAGSGGGGHWPPAPFLPHPRPHASPDAKRIIHRRHGGPLSRY